MGYTHHIKLTDEPVLHGSGNLPSHVHDVQFFQLFDDARIAYLEFLVYLLLAYIMVLGMLLLTVLSALLANTGLVCILSYTI